MRGAARRPSGHTSEEKQLTSSAILKKLERILGLSEEEAEAAMPKKMSNGPKEERVERCKVNDREGMREENCGFELLPKRKKGGQRFPAESLLSPSSASTRGSVCTCLCSLWTTEFCVRGGSVLELAPSPARIQPQTSQTPKYFASGHRTQRIAAFWPGFCDPELPLQRRTPANYHEPKGEVLSVYTVSAMRLTEGLVHPDMAVRCISTLY